MEDNESKTVRSIEISQPLYRVYRNQTEHPKQFYIVSHYALRNTI